MPHSFDSHALRQLLEDAEHLVVRACEDERRLADLVLRLESDGKDIPAPSVDGGHVDGGQTSHPHRVHTAHSGGRFNERSDLSVTVRDLCVAARDRRLIATTLLKRVIGELALDAGKNLTPTRVLVVDDSVDTCEMAAIVLENSGFRVITAVNGLEGVLAAHMATPAVVLMDITMPVLNGIEAARLLKASTATRDLQLIAYTAQPDFYDGPMTRVFAGVLSKPSTPDAIIASVRRCLVHSDEQSA